MFELFFFTTDEKVIKKSLLGEVSGFVIDWENERKPDRQRAFDTQINCDTEEDIKRVRSLANTSILCRINNPCNSTREGIDEIEMAVEGGADEILLPMVRTVEEVEKVLKQINRRCGLGILIETRNALKCVRELGQLPLTRVYVGLNDLAIERNKSNIFESLADGTIDYVRQFFKVPFGFAGLTRPECGYPIPCSLLISEMARLDCSFSFLRRSFTADVKPENIAVEIPRIRDAVRKAFQSSDKTKEFNRRKIKKEIARFSFRRKI